MSIKRVKNECPSVFQEVPEGIEKCGKCWVIIWHKSIVYIKLRCEIGIRFVIKNI